MRRQFRGSEETNTSDEQVAVTQEADLSLAAQKQRNRRFVIRPGDWDGVYIVGNRYVQLGPDVDRRTVRRYRRVVRELKTRFRTDRL